MRSIGRGSNARRQLHLAAVLAGVALLAIPAAAQTPYLVKDIAVDPGANPPASSNPYPIGSLGDKLFFVAHQAGEPPSLWMTTGTAGSTVQIPAPRDGLWKGLGTLGDAFLFGTYSHGVWSTDGTQQGTRILSTIGAFPSSMETWATSTQAFFTSNFPNEFRHALMRSDGSPEGTILLADPGVKMDQYPDIATTFGDGFAFIGLTPTSPFTYSRTLWRTDGTVAGTAPIGPEGLECNGIAAMDTRLFSNCGSDLWISDGTTAGTRLLKDFGPAGSPFDLQVVEDRLYFRTNGLWVSDGTPDGTRPLSDVAPIPPDLAVEGYVPSSGVLFFVGRTARTGRELWRTDGTAAGTFLLRDIEPGPGSSLGLFDWWGPAWLIAPAAGGVIFAATTEAAGSEPWFSDGTSAGTVPLGEVAPGTAHAGPKYFKAVGSRVYFSAYTQATGEELWAVDLSPAVLSVSDPVVREGDGAASFNVTLSGPLKSPATVWYKTVAATAQEGTDFLPRSGVLTFQPGTVEQVVEVSVVGDSVDEAAESFTLELTALTGGLRGDRRGVAVIVDDDAPPSAALAGDVTVTEGDVGTTDAVFQVVLTTRDGLPANAASTVYFVTEAVTAVAGVDFEPASGTVTFPAGTPSGTALPIHVPVIGDTVDEPDKSYSVRLRPYGGSAIASTASAHGTILDDDGQMTARTIEVSHGTTVRGTLAPLPGRTRDRDYYVIRGSRSCSFEAVLDEVSGDAVPIQLSLGNGWSATPTGVGSSVSLRWMDEVPSPVPANRFLYVESAACGTSCGLEDGYRLRVYETTLRAPRINNVGSQTTFAFIQNASSDPVSGWWTLWDEWGALLERRDFSLGPRASLRLATADFAAGKSGSMTVAHDGRYGSLVGKVVTIDAVTGFSFDSPMTYRPR